MNELQQAKKEYDEQLEKTQASSEKVVEKLTKVFGGHTFEEFCNADFDISPDGNYNRA